VADAEDKEDARAEGFKRGLEGKRDAAGATRDGPTTRCRASLEGRLGLRQEETGQNEAEAERSAKGKR
jgi:hypothetical protein